MSLKILIVFLSIFSSLETADPTLRLVNLVYRHGDRSPVVIFPNDTNKADKWPNGLGWLTKEGMMMQYNFGQWLRNRYDGFINSSYIHTEIEVASSNEDRCLMSAYCNLAGLYPPTGNQVWNPNLTNWQPVPVHTRPKKEDNVINLGENCPRYIQLYQETLNSPEIKQEEIKYKNFYDYVSKKSGMNNMNISNIWKIADTLLCEKAHNMTVVPWADQKFNKDTMTVYEKLQFLESWQFRLLYSGKEKSRLMGGPILGEFVQQMVAASQKKIKTKVFMYSGHDTTVAALLSALNLYSNGTSPPYAASVIVELHQNTQGKYYVNILYKHKTDKADLLKLPGCDVNCILEDFLSITKPYIPVDWNKECGLPPSGSSKVVLTIYQITTIILAGIILIMIIVLVLICCRFRKLQVSYKNFI